MLSWRYLPLRTHQSDEETIELIDKHLAPKISQLAPSSVCIDLDVLVAELKEKAAQFFAKTTVVDVWDHVPDDKKIRDWEYMSAVIHQRNNFDTYLGTDQEILNWANGKIGPRSKKESSPSTTKSDFAAFFDKLDEEREDLPMPPKTRDGGFAFIHALDTAVLFTEQEQYTQSQAASFLRKLLQGEAVYNALYLGEMLNHPERMEWQRGNNPVELARRITQNYALERNLTGFYTTGVVQFF